MHRTREIPRHNEAQRYALRYAGKARYEATLRNLHAEFSALVAKTNKIWVRTLRIAQLLPSVRQTCCGLFEKCACVKLLFQRIEAALFETRGRFSRAALTGSILDQGYVQSPQFLLYQRNVESLLKTHHHWSSMTCKNFFSSLFSRSVAGGRS